MACMILAGVVGWPISHTLSPLLHEYWLDRYQIAGTYIPIALRREDLAAAIAGLRYSGFVGLNVTLPYKEAALAISHEIDETARLCKAVNLILFREDGSIEGHNTDVSGLVESIAQELGTDSVRGRSAVLLGAGGASRAAAVALDTLGASEIAVFNRTPSRAEQLVADLQAGIGASLRAILKRDLHSVLEKSAILLNATSGGMTGVSGLDFSLDALPPTAAVCDLIYNPLETGLLQRARARGHRTMNGLGMLMYQAVPAFEALFGIRPAVDPLLRARLEQVLSS